MGIRFIPKEHFDSWPCGLPPPTLGVLPDESEPKLLTEVIELFERTNGCGHKSKNEKQGDGNYAR